MKNLSKDYKFRVLFEIFLLLTIITTAELVRINCDYKHVAWPIIGSAYTCQVRSLNVTQRKDSVLKVTGYHYIQLGNSHVRSIDIRAQTCHFLPSRIRNWFANLELIQVHNSRLKAIAQTDLQPFHRLRVLHLAANQLTTLDNNLFYHNPSLVRIDFKHQRLKHIGYNILDSLNQLAMANFEDGGCVNFYAQQGRKGIHDLKREIRVNCQPIAEMIIEVESLREKVSSLVEINQKTQELIKHMNYDDDPRIKKLNTMFNKIQLDNQKCLQSRETIARKYLDVSEQLTTVRESLNETQSCVLQDIEREKLERIKRDASSIDIHCELVELKDKLNDSTQLSCNIKNLKVKENDVEIARIINGHRSNIVDGSKVSEVKAFNGISIYLPLKLSEKFENLKILNFVECGLIEVNGDVLRGLKVLRSLILSHNLITNINRKAFQDLKLLNLLNLSHNKIEKIDAEIFQTLNELAIVNLSFNQIVELQADMFKNQKNMKVLLMHQNNLTIIDGNALDPHRKLEFVDFNGNNCIDKSSTKTELKDFKAALLDDCSNSSQSLI